MPNLYPPIFDTSHGIQYSLSLRNYLKEIALQNIKAKVINCPFKKLEIYMGSTVSFIIPIKFYAAINKE